MREQSDAVSDAERRSDMAALARRFPGALREIDERPLHEVRARIETLDMAFRCGSTLPTWAAIQATYHGAMRAFLRVRPAVRRSSDEAARAFVEASYWPQFADEPSQQAMLGPVLDKLRDLPGGRLNPVAFEFVAEQVCVEVQDVIAALFKP